jgi:hypothetical protein
MYPLRYIEDFSPALQASSDGRSDFTAEEPFHHPVKPTSDPSERAERAKSTFAGNSLALTIYKIAILIVFLAADRRPLV